MALLSAITGRDPGPTSAWTWQSRQAMLHHRVAMSDR